LLVLVGAIWYSVSVIVTDIAAKNDDPMTVAVYQLLFIGIFALIGAFIFEDVRLPSSGTEWGAILGLALICSGVGFTLQPIGQKFITPERAGLLVVFNPLAATLLGVLFLGEHLTPTIIIGGILIIISILTPAWFNKKS
jgi:drug/metabolite transporter (DMT)-like permease